MKRLVLAGILCGSVLLLGVLRWATAGVHEVWDEAHFFKTPTIAQVDQIIDDIRNRFHKDLMIETFASIPDDLKNTFQEQGKEKFYQGWTRSEADQLGVNGVIILVTGQPPHLQVEVGNATQQRAFTLEDRNELVTLLAGAFRKKDFDGGIVQAAQFVHDRMAKNLAGAPATQPTTQPVDERGLTK